MKRTTFVVAAILLAACVVHTQEPPKVPDPQAVVPPPAQPVTPPPAQTPAPQAQAPVQQPRPPGMTREQLQRIYHIRQFESLLTNAVKVGTTSLANQLQIAEPSVLFVTSDARTRGFELEGYGVFFAVDVPTMLQSVVWSAQIRQQQQQNLTALREAASDPKVNANLRRFAELELRRLERSLGLQPAPLTPADTMQVAPPGTAVAATADNVVPASGGAAGMRSLAPVALPPPDPRDPNEIYTETIKDKLIDAMLAYGSALKLNDSEWLSIAARATSDGPPGQLDDRSSLMLRIKGADLNAYIQNKITKDEVIKKIEVKEG